MIKDYSASQVEALGRKVLYDPKHSKGEADTVLIAVVDNGTNRIASDGIASLHAAHKKGGWITFDVYAVPENKLDLCAESGLEASTLGMTPLQARLMLSRLQARRDSLPGHT